MHDFLIVSLDCPLRREALTFYLLSSGLAGSDCSRWGPSWQELGEGRGGNYFGTSAHGLRWKAPSLWLLASWELLPEDGWLGLSAPPSGWEVGTIRLVNAWAWLGLCSSLSSSSHAQTQVSWLPLQGSSFQQLHWHVPRQSVRQLDGAPEFPRGLVKAGFWVPHRVSNGVRHF